MQRLPAISYETGATNDTYSESLWDSIKKGFTHAKGFTENLAPCFTDTNLQAEKDDETLAEQCECMI